MIKGGTLMELISIIESAIEDEKNAQIKYRQGYEKAENPQAKAMFEQLIKDEEGHEKYLNQVLKALKMMEGS